MFKMISRSWHMYPLGFLFGLGFDTATEIVSVFGISAVEASNGQLIVLGDRWSFQPSLWHGMSLIDTTDNILMLGAYGWAYVKPIRKLYYNMTITCVSVVVAIVVGGIEALGLLAGRLPFYGQILGWSGGAQRSLRHAQDISLWDFCAMSWIVSVAVYKWRRFDDLGTGRLKWVCRIPRGASFASPVTLAESSCDVVGLFVLGPVVF